VSVCPFCDPKTIANAIFENEHIYIVPNLTQYDLWELHDVTDHLLVIPRRHTKALSELDQAERLAIIEACAQYEAKSYSLYARGTGVAGRSVDHQHTHLIKVVDRPPRVAFFWRKPYFLFKL
jgi:diadenosine tetraphosphate (Ap4A) HIT family hydrolase